MFPIPQVVYPTPTPSPPITSRTPPLSVWSTSTSDPSDQPSTSSSDSLSSAIVFILVPGEFQPPHVYGEVQTQLGCCGYEVETLPLPSQEVVEDRDARSKDLIRSFIEDVECIRHRLDYHIVEQEKKVILVMHGYAGLPGTQAPRYYSRAARKRDEWRGGVIGMVYIQAWTPQKLAGLRDDIESHPDVTALREATGIGPEVQNDEPYNVTAEGYIDQRSPFIHGRAVQKLMDQINFVAWRKIPSTYLMGEKILGDYMMKYEHGYEHDLTETPSFEQTVWRAITTFQTIEVNHESIFSGHCPMLHRSDWILGALKRSAGEHVPFEAGIQAWCSIKAKHRGAGRPNTMDDDQEMTDV
ncbi:uncharacterized protein KY384_004742 [Bacidia gigantensis]|uniref:uncharacterized protein n=1 Tax=Bacidia gigantensis TaxID=2732470 RepID=UPI001D04DACD|nr:uncharacterized protein KY384_004742 [Bacidia gigantensis]KAG8530242.1 hypothetical protein KY384_004742 [Bacidia gigantensis]